MFKGTVDPAVAEEWISMIKKIFDFVQIEVEDKVKCGEPCSVYIEKGHKDMVGRSKEDLGCGSNDLG